MHTTTLPPALLLLFTTLSPTYAHPPTPRQPDLTFGLEFLKDTLPNLEYSTKLQQYGADNCYGDWSEAKKCRDARDGTFTPKMFEVDGKTVWQCCFDVTRIPIRPVDEVEASGDDVIAEWKAGNWDT